MSAIPLTRQQVNDAGDLDFDATRSEKHANITIEVAPDGLHIRCEYTGTLSSIPAAIERLRSAGVLELVSAARASGAPSPATNGNGKPKAERVEPLYKPDGTACCPEHRTPLRDGKWGKFCPTKDKTTGEYCKLKFVDDGDLI